MWIFLVELAGAVMALGGWFILHSFWCLLAGVILIIFFDILMSSSGGQLKSWILSILLPAAGGLIGGLTDHGILTTAMLFFSVYSAVILMLKLCLLMLAALDRE